MLGDRARHGPVSAGSRERRRPPPERTPTTAFWWRVARSSNGQAQPRGALVLALALESSQLLLDAVGATLARGYDARTPTPRYEGDTEVQREAVDQTDAADEVLVVALDLLGWVLATGMGRQSCIHERDVLHCWRAKAPEKPLVAAEMVDGTGCRPSLRGEWSLERGSARDLSFESVTTVSPVAESVSD